MIDSGRRALMLGLGGLALSACAPNSSVGLIWRGYRDLRKAQREYPLSPEQIRAFGAPLLGVQVRDGFKGLMARHSTGDLEIWRSSNGIELELRGQRIVRSLGFSPDLRACRPLLGDDPLQEGRLPAQEVQFSLEMDLGPDRYGLSVEYRLRPGRTGPLAWLDGERSAQVWEETVRSPGLRQAWRNRHWSDPADGRLLRSEQAFDAETGIDIEWLDR